MQGLLFSSFGNFPENAENIYREIWTDNERFRRLVLISSINSAHYLPQSCRKSWIKCALCRRRKLNYIAAYLFLFFFILLTFPEERPLNLAADNHFFECYTYKFHKGNKPFFSNRFSKFRSLNCPQTIRFKFVPRLSDRNSQRKIASIFFCFTTESKIRTMSILLYNLEKNDAL